MPQTGRFPENMTIAQVVDMMKDIRKPFVSKLDEELIESFGLSSIMDKRMRTLSGGTRQKVGAALAFMFDPAVLILDEPTAGLDPVSTEILKKKVRKEKANGKLLMITSHVLSDLDDIITQIIYMEDGKLKFHKSFEQLKEDTGEVQLSKAIAHVMQNN
jgi:Cu-processing system ATP-binding protein